MREPAAIAHQRDARRATWAMREKALARTSSVRPRVKIEVVPTIARNGPFRLFIYSNEGSEDPHVHVQRDQKIAKFWLDPVALASSGHFSPVELREIERIVVENQEMLIEAWNEFFGR